ncbi:MAG: HAMP domain-containing protein [Desulfuromonadales bacterium]|nr:HAMP domain-containing protein [Desulfuromonadales bacterium]
MRLALKHQIIMAPAAVLLMMTLLLGFLQFTYWDMSLKRQQAKNLKTVYISLAEADMAVQRMQGVVHALTQVEIPDSHSLEHVTDLYQHLESSIGRVQGATLLSSSSMSLLQQALTDLDPDQGIQLARFDTALGVLRPHLAQLLKEMNQRYDDVSSIHRVDIEALVAKTTLVSIVVLGVAILVGILLSLMFARRILRRIQVLSSGAERITRGDFSPPPAPDRIQDELDGLAVSINQMTEQLIRVVSAEKLLEGAEEERRRIAMDIHDQTLADLSSVRRGLEQMSTDSTCSADAARIEEDLHRATANLRVVMDNLHPQTLDILGLPAAIESHLEKVCETTESLDYHFMSDVESSALPLTRLEQVTLYRIVIEAISNVLRHAQADKLEVNLTKRADILVVAVEDNGRGFIYEPQLPSQTGGRGLHNILERARAIGANVEWRHSRFSTGARFELLLPLNAGDSL